MKNNFLFKKLLFGLLFVVIGFLGVFYACNKSSVLVVDSLKDQSVKKDGLEKQVGISEEDDRAPKKLFLSDFMVIGEKHNEGLDFVLRKMVEARKAGKSVDEIRNVEFIMNSTIDFIAQDSGFKDQVKYLQENKNNIIKDISMIINRGSYEYLTNTILNSKQRKYALKLLDLPSVNWFSSVHDFVKEIQGSGLSVSEQYPLFAMASVALKSAEYWMEKEQLWKEVLSVRNNKSILEGHAIVPIGLNKAALEADVVSAAGNAAYSLVLLSVPVGGWLAFCGRVVAAAVCSSAVSSAFH